MQERLAECVPDNFWEGMESFGVKPKVQVGIGVDPEIADFFTVNGQVAGRKMALILEMYAASALKVHKRRLRPYMYRKARRGTRTEKVYTSVLLDESLLDFYKAPGPGHIQRMEDVLRSFMEAQKELA